MRHEIVHAFLSESGLSDSSSHLNTPWATNEEMVDWVAKQGAKIAIAWGKLGCGDDNGSNPAIMREEKTQN